MKPEVISFDTPLVTAQPNPATNVQIEQKTLSTSAEAQTSSALGNLPKDFSGISFSTPLHRVAVTSNISLNPIVQTPLAAVTSASRPINRRVETLRPVWATATIQPKVQNTQPSPRQQLPLDQLPIESLSPSSTGIVTAPLKVVAQRKKLTNIIGKIHVLKPQFSFPNIKLIKLHNRVALGGVGLLLIGLVVVSSLVLLHLPKTTRIIEKGSGNTLSVSASTARASESQLSDSPAATLSSTNSDSSTKSSSKVAPFAPVVPVGESQLADLGGDAYDSVHQVYTFDDLYMAEPLQVSEQELPTQYGSVVATIAAVAKAVKATTPIPTNSGVTGYMYEDPKSQADTVIYSMEGLLVLIKSSYPHSTAEWAQYLESLQ